MADADATPAGTAAMNYFAPGDSLPGLTDSYLTAFAGRLVLRVSVHRAR